MRLLPVKNQMKTSAKNPQPKNVSQIIADLPLAMEIDYIEENRPLREAAFAYFRAVEDHVAAKSAGGPSS